MDLEWAERALKGVAVSLETELKKAEPLTHIAHGKVAKMRLSSTKDAALRELPEGLVDPLLKTISFWNGEKKLAVLHYYARHPMSYYDDGIVTHDFVGTARARRTHDDGVPHLYFSGCGGNIGAGKYNDASKEAPVRLGENIHAAMVASEQRMKRALLTKMEWRVLPVVLKANSEFPEERMLKVCENATASASTRISAAFRVGFSRQSAAGGPMQFTSLHLVDGVCLLHLPEKPSSSISSSRSSSAPGDLSSWRAMAMEAQATSPWKNSLLKAAMSPRRPLPHQSRKK